METQTRDNLLAGDFPLVTDSLTILSGQNLTRGAVLGKITASGKYKLCDTAAADGSQTPARVLAENVDATGGDKVAIAYKTGEFNEAAISLGGATTADAVRAALEDRSIFLKTISK